MTVHSSVRDLIAPRASRPLLIAHRGLSERYPENTLAAFRAAIEAGVSMIELDVTLSHDGFPVVIHDETLERTTDGSGPVSALDLARLRRLDAGTWRGPAFRGERIPTLDEVLDLAAGRVCLNIEIKSEAVADHIEGGVVERVVSAVQRGRLQSEVLLSSFERRAMQQARALAPGIARAALLWDPLPATSALGEVLATGAVSLHLRHVHVTPEMVAACHQQGVAVLAYTVNTQAELDRLRALGADGVFSDAPDRLRG